MENYHDHEIVKYEVNLKERLITLFMKYTRSYNIYDCKVEFSDVFAHYIENALSGSIILELVKGDIACFVKDNVDLLSNHRNYLWPKDYDTLDELEMFLTEGKYEYYIIMSSYGLSGWILSKGIHKN